MMPYLYLFLHLNNLHQLTNFDEIWCGGHAARGHIHSYFFISYCQFNTIVAAMQISEMEVVLIVLNVGYRNFVS
jgi:hypothetical protein